LNEIKAKFKCKFFLMQIDNWMISLPTWVQLKSHLYQGPLILKGLSLES